MSSSAKALFLPSFKNILFATDLSPCSQAAFPYLRAIATRYGSTVHLIHVLAPEPMIELPLDMPPELDADQDSARATIRALMAGKPLDKVACTTTVKRGHIWKTLSAFIEEKNIDLIVMGTHGRSGLQKLALGSVAEQVLRLAPCPVVTVGPHTINNCARQPRIMTVLFSTDFSSGSQHALPYALSLARTNNSRLIVLHVLSPRVEFVSAKSFTVGPENVEVSTELVGGALERARQQIAGLLPAEFTQGLEFEIDVKCGPAAETILESAMNSRADLIVMGAHRASESSLANHIPWATVSRVVREARCPTLTVRS